MLMPSIDALLPHAGRMRLVDRIVSYDEQRIVCESDSHRAADHPLADAGTLSIVVALEYGAQAMAIHGGLLAAMAQPQRARARHGFLVAASDLKWSVDRLDTCASPLIIEAVSELRSDNHVAYRFEVRAADVTLFRGRASVLLDRPRTVSGFNVTGKNSPAGESLALPRLCLARFDSPLNDAWQTARIAQLTPTERTRLARIDRPLRREQFVVGHWMLRRVLTDAEHRDAAIEVDAEGQVRLAAKVPLFASIAHSANTVAVVVAGFPVGVDLESMQPLRDARAAAEMLGLAAADAEESGSVLRAWVAAEARMKAGP
ncbi:MAG: hypothetical protein ACXW16_12310, partial [Burkholderiaceae bacterium]